jgi:hypothetical protein
MGDLSQAVGLGWHRTVPLGLRYGDPFGWDSRYPFCGYVPPMMLPVHQFRMRNAVDVTARVGGHDLDIRSRPALRQSSALPTRTRLVIAMSKFSVPILISQIVISRLQPEAIQEVTTFCPRRRRHGESCESQFREGPGTTSFSSGFLTGIRG